MPIFRQGISVFSKELDHVDSTPFLCCQRSTYGLTNYKRGGKLGNILDGS